MRVGRLHTHQPGWADANIAFMRSGGYAISGRIPDVTQPTLVLWGRQDEILEVRAALCCAAGCAVLCIVLCCVLAMRTRDAHVECFQVLTRPARCLPAAPVNAAQVRAAV